MDKGDVVYICNKIFFSLKKEKKLLPFVTAWTNLEGIMPSESQGKKTLYELTYMWNLIKLRS